LVASGAVPVVELNEIFRQAQQNSIIVNAHRISNGILPLFKAPENQLEDFYFIGVVHEVEPTCCSLEIRRLFAAKEMQIERIMRHLEHFNVFKTTIPEKIDRHFTTPHHS
jgi:ATP-dependent exoDNAse (exonuclease V) alpha subunit